MPSFSLGDIKVKKGKPKKGDAKDKKLPAFLMKGKKK
jgi:hypothetical protein